MPNYNNNSNYSKPKAPPGFHYMPDGTLMSDSEMVKNKSMTNLQMSNNQSNINTILSASTQSIPTTVQTSNINANPLNNLDPSKLAQLTPEQLAKFKSLSPKQVKALNNLPIGQLKNLSVDQLKKQATAALSNAQNKLKDTKEQLEKGISNAKSKLDALKKANDPTTFLKDQLSQSPAASANAIASIVFPILIKFINAEKVANLIINKLINDSKKKLKNKGRFVVVNGAITFTPKDKGNYIKYKQNFDRKVNALKKVVNVLKTIIDTLVIILKFVKIGLSAFKVLLAMKKAKLAAKTPPAAADLAGPNQSKPTAASWAKDIGDEVATEKIEELNEKINNYLLMATFISTILGILKKMIDDIKRKLDTLSFTIQGIPDSAALNDSLNSYTPISDTDIEITDSNNGDKSYTIKVITTLSGALQAIAYDKFSMLKITQTAPSKTRKADELINELKQILGQ